MTTLSHYILFIALLITCNTSIYAQELLYKDVDNSGFYKGIELFEKQKYGAAQHYLDRYVHKFANSEYAIEASYYSALCAVKLDRSDGIERLQQFVAKYPYNYRSNLAYYELGNIYCNKQDYCNCIDYYLRIDADKLDESLKAELQYRLAYAYLSNKDFDQALERFNDIKNYEGPYTAASNYYAGYLALKKGYYDIALVDLRKAGEDEAYKPVVPYLILEVFYQAKDFKQVIKYAQEIQLQQPSLKNQEDIELLTAESYFFLKDYTSAIKHYENYIYLQPSEVTDKVRYRLAYALYQTGENYKSIKYLNELALTQDYIAQLASYYMGLIYIKTDQKSLALAAFDQARQLNFISNIKLEAAFQYVKLSYELGNLNIAINALKKFQKTFPNSKYKSEVDKLLSQVYFNANNYDLTITYIDGLADKSDEILEVYQKATFYKGNSCFNTETYDKAIVWLNKSLLYNYDPDITIQANLWLGESHAALQAYAEASKYYQKVIHLTDKQKLSYYKDAVYGLGYCYFNIEDYEQALSTFLKYIDLTDSNTSNWYMDALVRIADCYYATKNYTKALEIYEQAQNQYPAHSRYQKAMIYDIINNFTEAQQNLEIIINNYANTDYYEKALYQYAFLALKYQDYTLAVKGFTDFIANKPYSALVPDALLNRAVARVNLKQYEEAGKDYELILRDYPTHPNAQSALLELPKLILLGDKPEKLQEYLARYKASNPDSDKLEIINFEAAKNLFYTQNYKRAIEYLENFISNYPNSKFIHESSFMIAEAYYRLGNDEQALVQYHIINQNKQSPFYNRVLLRIAFISYKHKDFKSALMYYNELKERANNKKELYYALEGIMKTNDELQQYDEVSKAAALIMKQGNITLNATTQATLYLAKACIKQDKKQEAIKYLKQVIDIGQDIYAAEAQYMIAHIHYESGKYKQSLEALFTLNKQYTNYADWINKSFLLIADNYIALKDIFQAKATLQSIIENAQDTTIVQIAKDKLQLINQQIEADSLAQIAQNAKSQEQTKEFKTLDEDQTPNP